MIETWETIRGTARVLPTKTTDGRYLLELPGAPIAFVATRDDIEEMAERDKANLSRHLESEKARTHWKRNEAEYLDGFGDGLTPMALGRVKATLLRDMRLNGKVASRRNHIRQMVASGWKVEGGRLVNGARFLLADDMTKTAIDYASYLIGSKPENSV
jgi:hypothetical protein